MSHVIDQGSEHIEKLVAIANVRDSRMVSIIDPKTGKCYMPNVGWQVTGLHLEELFHEVDENGKTK